MPRSYRLTLGLAALLFMAACGKDSPAAPSPTPPPTPTPTPSSLVLSGTVRGADTNAGLGGALISIGDGPNAGKSTTTDGGGNYSLAGLTSSGFTISVSAVNYLSVQRGVTLTSSQSANFTLIPAVPWSRTGVGDNVFDIPAYFSRVHITGVPTTRCQNFVVKIGGDLKVNVILGTCSVADGSRYDGIVSNPGGTVSIEISTGIQWALSEVR